MLQKRMVVTALALAILGCSSGGGSIPADAIDPTAIFWDAAVQIDGWEVDSELSSVSLAQGKATASRTNADSWPLLIHQGWPTPFVGEWWIVAKLNGQWRATTFALLDPGSPVATSLPKLGSLRGPLARWRPRSGEQVGIVLSTFATGGQWTTAERTNIVTATWP